MVRVPSRSKASRCVNMDFKVGFLLRKSETGFRKAREGRSLCYAPLHGSELHKEGDAVLILQLA